MGKLVCIVGNNASGKTTLAKRLCQAGPFAAYLEDHEGRPYQRLFSENHRKYALPNQIDYMLYRAEQEKAAREGEGVGVQDGGLDQDFFLYTRLFLQKGFLEQTGYDLCRRLHALLRSLLPPPDLFVRLTASFPILEARLGARGRRIDEDIVGADDLPYLEACLQEWMEAQSVAVVMVDSSSESPDYETSLEKLLSSIEALDLD